MTHVGIFPFGQPINTLTQFDRGPRRVFVLGVYASAVHARWIGTDRKTRVKALAVASEPEIFWTGHGAAALIRQVSIPKEAGYLRPAAPSLNGPSEGVSTKHYLKLSGSPCGYMALRLVPHSCMNDGNAGQSPAYRPLMRALDYRKVLAEGAEVEADWRGLVDSERMDGVASEVAEASPEILITLGDAPLRRFGRCFGTRSSLAAYGRSRDEYGRLHGAKIAGHQMQLLPLAHPRQVVQLGRSSPEWTELHRYWIAAHAPSLCRKIAQRGTIQPIGQR